MNAELDRLRKEMTREEFVNKLKTKVKKSTENCPDNRFGLEVICSNNIKCKECYRNAVKDIKFKDDIEKYTGIKDSGDRTSFDTGAVRDMHEGKGRMDLLPWNAIIEISKHCEEGAKKYGEHNVDKGIPIHSLLDSGIRHTAKYMTGKKDEPHLRSAIWNLLWALEFEITMPEMQDIPSRKVSE